MPFNLFGKYFKLTFLFIALIELLSLSGHIYPVFNTVCFFVILFFVLILSLEKLKYGLYIVLAELIIGSQGYLFSYDDLGTKVSIRIGIFLIVMSVWFFKMIQKKDFSIVKFKYFKYYLALFAVVALGVVNAYISGIPFSSIFFDANGFLFLFLVFPFAFVIKDFKRIIPFLQVFFGALSASILKVFILFYIFTHDTWAIAPSVYKWVRDTRIGEVTKMKQGFFRIFFQSQLYAVIGLFILLALIFGLYLLNKNFKDYKKDKNFIKLSLFVVFIFTSVIISLSRSFWAGGITAGIVFVGLFLLFFKERLLFIKYIIISVAVLMAGGYLVIFILAKFPLPYQKGDGAMMSFISSRAKLDIKESATASRWSMLPPLVGKILERSIIGHGFGQEVTYKSSDPRVVASTAGQTGLYTTYAFEWGYLDMWLKFGLFGVGVLIWFLFVLFWDGVKISREFILGLNNKKDGHGDLNDGHGELNDCHGELVEPLLILGLLLGFVALGASHGFSPYLNHPLGIGYLIIFSLMLGKYNSKLTI